MKHLLLITVLAMALTTKLLAQEKSAIEIKGLEKQPFELMKNNDNSIFKDQHQFEIVAHDDVEINLTFTLKTEDNVNVVVTDKIKNVVFSKVYHKKGNNRLEFLMNENEKYLIQLSSSKQSNMVVCLTED